MKFYSVLIVIFKSVRPTYRYWYTSGIIFTWLFTSINEPNFEVLSYISKFPLSNLIKACNLETLISLSLISASWPLPSFKKVFSIVGLIKCITINPFLSGCTDSRSKYGVEGLFISIKLWIFPFMLIDPILIYMDIDLFIILKNNFLCNRILLSMKICHLFSFESIF